MLLAIGFPFRNVNARRVNAFILSTGGRVFVVDMSIALLFSRPSKLVVLAILLCAFPRPTMGFFVLRKIARPFELLLAVSAGVHYICGSV
jgi:hypothetical protein